MNLPPLTIPDFPLPFEIPAMMHPAIVHFAVALPVVIILLELINLAVRRKVLGSISFVLMVLMVLVYLGAYLTGAVDADKAKSLLSPEAKTLLDAHKSGGIWMVYGSVVVIVFKLISVTVKKIPVRIVYLLVLGLFFWGATSVVQKGCALTYKHGVNVHKDAVPAASNVPTEDPKKETVADSVKKAKEAAADISKVVKEKTARVVEKAREKAAEAAAVVKEETSQVVEKARETTGQATEAVKAKTGAATQKAEKVIEKIVEPAPKEPVPAAEPVQPVIPVETVPAG